MAERTYELLITLEHLGYLKVQDNYINFNKEKIKKKLKEIGTIVLHEYVYNIYAKDKLFLGSLVIRSICTTPEEFRKLLGTEKIEDFNEGIRSEYIERCALIEFFYNVDEPEYKDGFYYFMPNFDEIFNLFNKSKKIKIIKDTLKNNKLYLLN